MKILIVGPPDSPQKDVLDILGVKLDADIEPGLVLDHKFKTRYFEQVAGVWVDQYDDIHDWITTFTSKEAQEVRQALMMVIFTEQSFEKLAAAAPFIELLQQEDLGVYTSAFAAKKPLIETLDKLDQVGVDVLLPDELLEAIYSAIVDYNPSITPQNPDDGSFEDPDELLEPLLGDEPADLNSIVEILKNARISDMSDEEKRKLADDLAKQLVP